MAQEIERVEVGKYLVIDPAICHGQMTFAGTRVPVDTVLTYLAKGYSIDQLVRSWPELSKPAIEEAIVLASRSLHACYAPGSALAAPAGTGDSWNHMSQIILDDQLFDLEASV